MQSPKIKAFAQLKDTLYHFRSICYHAIFICYSNFSYPRSIPNFLVLCTINSHFREPTTPARLHPPRLFHLIASAHKITYIEGALCVCLFYSIHQLQWYYRYSIFRPVNYSCQVVSTYTHPQHATRISPFPRHPSYHYNRTYLPIPSQSPSHFPCP